MKSLLHRDERGAVPVSPDRSAPAPVLLGEAIGGPCDGLRFVLPGLARGPRRMWLGDEAPYPFVRHHPYRLQHAVNGVGLYRHCPTTEPARRRRGGGV